MFGFTFGQNHCIRSDVWDAMLRALLSSTLADLLFIGYMNQNNALPLTTCLTII